MEFMVHSARSDADVREDGNYRNLFFLAVGLGPNGLYSFGFLNDCP